MDVRLSTLTTSELEHAADLLANSAILLRALGRYPAAAVCLAVAREANQHLLRRQADHRQHIARQLTLVPPGAYEEPF